MRRDGERDGDAAQTVHVRAARRARPHLQRHRRRPRRRPRRTGRLQYGFNPADSTDGAVDSDGDGRTNAQECTDLTHPRGLYTRYLAEGATGSFFDTRVVLANPGATPARVLFRFQTNLGQVVRHFLVMPATSRRTMDLRLLPGSNRPNISTVVESDVQVVVDRTMRWDQVSRAGAHAEIELAGAVADVVPRGRRDARDVRSVLPDPEPEPDAVGAGADPLPAAGRRADRAGHHGGAEHARDGPRRRAARARGHRRVRRSSRSLNGVPIIVERAMYSSAAGTFAAGHDSAGVTSPSLEWFFAEGATGAFFDTFVLLANPNASAANVAATLPAAVGRDRQTATTWCRRTAARTINVAGAERRSSASTAVSVRLASTNGVSFIAERAMWWPHGQPWTEAHNAAGATTTGTKWAVADGEVGLLPEDTATFLLVANTAGVAGVGARHAAVRDRGRRVSRTSRSPANARFNVPVVTSEAPASAGLHAGAARDAVQRGGREPRRRRRSSSSGRCTGTPTASSGPPARICWRPSCSRVRDGAWPRRRPHDARPSASAFVRRSDAVDAGDDPERAEAFEVEGRAAPIDAVLARARRQRRHRHLGVDRGALAVGGHADVDAVVGPLLRERALPLARGSPARRRPTASARSAAAIRRCGCRRRA